MDGLSLVKDNHYIQESENYSEEELFLKRNNSTEEDLFLKDNDSTLQSRAAKAKNILKRQNWKNIGATVCLLMAVVACSAAFSLMGPFFPQEALDKGASSSIVGVIISFAPLSVAVLSPVFGYLLPFVGVPAYTLTGLLIVGISYIFLGFAIKIPSTWGFILTCMLLRIAEGVGTALFYTATLSTFPKLFPNSVSLFMGLFEAAIGLGCSIGRPLGGVLYLLGGFKLPFLAIGISVTVISIPCVLLVGRMEIERKKEFLSWTITLSISTDLYFIVSALAVVIAYAAFSNMGPTLEPFLIKRFHVTPVDVSFVYFVYGLLFALANIPAGIISNKLRSIHISSIGLIVEAVGMFLLGMQSYAFGNMLLVYVSVGIIGVGGTFAVIPVYYNLIIISERYLSKGENKATLISFVSGILSASVSLGQFIGPLLGGTFTGLFSFSISSFLIGEIAIAEVLLLYGISAIDQFTWTEKQAERTNH